MIGARYTLLLVDDEPLVLEALRRTLRSEGYRLLVAHSPAEALALLETEAVDLLISDIDMPHMSGIELALEVRRRHPGVVRILLTGHGTLDAAMRAINDGEVFRFLTKPWDDARLRDTIGQALVRLEELRRAAAADRAAGQHRQLVADLEREHPGISAVAKDRDGVYVLDDRRLALLETFLDDPALRVLLGCPAPGDSA